jgi:hypothetical protein
MVRSYGLLRPVFLLLVVIIEVSLALPNPPSGVLSLLPKMLLRNSGSILLCKIAQSSTPASFH